MRREPPPALPAVSVPACIVVAEAVAVTRKVQPLWVTKLVADEGEVGFSSQPKGGQSDELVEGHPSVYERCPWRRCGHVSIHLSVHQPERQSLIANQSLVMTLCIRHTALIRPEGGRCEGGSAACAIWSLNLMPC